ncbi:MAG: hypothetical protein ACOCRX_05500 [Candidatus Woesearchaeota archaeon]
MLNNNYTVYFVIAMVAILFFIIGRKSVDDFAVPPTNNEEIINESEQGNEEATSERKADYLFGVVQEIKTEDDGEIVVVKLNLSQSFSGDSFKNPEPSREFIYEEDRTKVYKSLDSDISNENKEEATFNFIEGGDEIAIKCSLPPQTSEELMSYDRFTATEMLIRKKENE